MAREERASNDIRWKMEREERELAREQQRKNDNMQNQQFLATLFMATWLLVVNLKNSIVIRSIIKICFLSIRKRNIIFSKNLYYNGLLKTVRIWDMFVVLTRRLYS